MIDNSHSPRQDTANTTNFSPSPPNSPRHTLWLWIIGAVAVVLVISTISIFAFTRQSASSSSQTGAQTTATATNAPSITPTTTSASTGGSTGSSSGGPFQYRRLVQPSASIMRTSTPRTIRVPITDGEGATATRPPTRPSRRGSPPHKETAYSRAQPHNALTARSRFRLRLQQPSHLLARPPSIRTRETTLLA